MSALSVDNLAVTLGGNRILDRLSLAVDSGEVVAVLGASGSGKSTLLRAIAGLIGSTGSITLGSASIDELPTHRRGLGMMFQDHALFPHLTVRENVAFGLEELRWEPHAINERVDGLLETAELGGLGARSIGSLSGGEAQRVALVRALAPQPRLLMLDEPLGSLDRRLRDELADELHRLLALTGTTALYVTHDQSEAAVVANRIVVLDMGQIVADGTAESLWQRPPTPAMAKFLGHRNVSPRANVPITAIEVKPSQSGPAVVRTCRFVDGRWKLKLDLLQPGGEFGMNEFHAESDDPMSPGTTVEIAFDMAQIHLFATVD